MLISSCKAAVRIALEPDGGKEQISKFSVVWRGLANSCAKPVSHKEGHYSFKKLWLKRNHFFHIQFFQMNCCDGSDYLLVGNCNVTPPYGGQLLSAAQRMRTAGGAWGEMKVPYNQHERSSHKPREDGQTCLGKEPMHREFVSCFHLSHIVGGLQLIPFRRKN